MNINEFYTVIKEYAKKEIFEQGKKASSATGIESARHEGASHEAAKFYQLIESLWIDYNKETTK